MKYKTKTLNNRLLLLTIIINVLIPKAGIKIGEIPLTLGNVLFGMLILIFTFSILFKKEYEISIIELIILFEMIYFFIRIILTCLLVEEFSSLSFSYIIALSIYPIIYFIIKHYITKRTQVIEIYSIIDKCLVIVFAYAIIQFVFGIGNTDIPGITVNYSDYIKNPTAWWMYKNNGVIEDSTKMFSTYQNGNIFGLVVLLLFPLCFNNPNRKPQNRIVLLVIFIFICLLSGSRTTVLGCAVYIMILLWNYLKRTKINQKTFMYILLLTVPCIIFLAYFLYKNINSFFVRRALTIFDRNTLINGAGRTGSMLKYFNWLFRNTNPAPFVLGGYGFKHDGGAYEMTYVAIFVIGGLIGLILFLIPIFYSVKKSKIYLNHHNDWMVNGAREGILVYSIAAFVEGAYFLPPTALNVWIVIALIDILTNYSNEYTPVN